MTGQVIHTEKGVSMVAYVIEDDDGFAVTARYGPREGVIAQRGDKRAAKALARSVVALEAVEGFPEWLASREGMARAF